MNAYMVGAFSGKTAYKPSKNDKKTASLPSIHGGEVFYVVLVVCVEIFR